MQLTLPHLTIWNILTISIVCITAARWLATICGQSVSCCLQISTLQCSQFFSPPAFILTISCFFQLWAPAQKILVFRLVKRSFSYTEICLPVPISSGNDYIPEAYIYIYINGFHTAPLSETLNTVKWLCVRCLHRSVLATVSEAPLWNLNLVQLQESAGNWGQKSTASADHGAYDMIWNDIT